MQIVIRARNFPLTNTQRSYAERCLRSALTCCDIHIQRVVMHLFKSYVPRGGAVKCCHLQVVLTGLSDVVTEDFEVDLYVAIYRATDRARRTVVRKIDRQQSMLKQGHSLVSDAR